MAPGSRQVRQGHEDDLLRAGRERPAGCYRLSEDAVEITFGADLVVVLVRADLSDPHNAIVEVRDYVGGRWPSLAFPKTLRDRGCGISNSTHSSIAWTCSSGLSARYHASPSSPMSRTMGVWLSMRSALGRDHLTAQLACGIRLRVDVHVPFARCALLCLLGRQRGLPAYRISGRGAPLSQPDHHRSALARYGRAVEMRQSDRARQPTIRDVPGDHLGCRVIGEFNLSRAARRYWRHALLPGQCKFEGVGPRRPGPGDSGQGGGKNEDSPRDCGTHDCPPTVPTARNAVDHTTCRYLVISRFTPVERPLLAGERHGIKLNDLDRRTRARGQRRFA